MIKLLINTQNSVVISATLLDVFTVTTEPVQTGIDQAAYATLQKEFGGQRLAESEFFRRCGTFTITTVVLTTQSQRHILAPHARLIDPPEETADILRYAASGKYRLFDDAIVLNMAWQEPTFYIEPLPVAGEGPSNSGKQAKAAPVKKKR